MNIGLNIKKLRIAKGMTQEELAEYTGVSSRAVSRWENSITFPDITLLPVLANIFEVAVDELLDVDVYKKEQDIKQILEENQKYKHTGEVEKSGISIKKDDSENYTLIKLTPNSFNELFGTYELGYGASVFCKRSSELHYNIPLLDGWKTTIEDLQDYFDSDDITEMTLTESIELCQKLKNFSVDRIKYCIDNSPRL